jgi:hypothetical protein
MLGFIAIAFTLYIVFFIGWNVGNSVPDEIIPSRRYLEIGIDLLLLAMLCIVLFGFGHYLAATLILVAVLAARYFLPFTYVYAPLSGVLLAASTLLPAQVQVAVAVLCLALNFLLGATSKLKVLMRSILQPLAAVALALILAFVL